MKESDCFEFMTLAQVPCNITKTTTYFAKLKGTNEVVFVKGPLNSKFNPHLFLEIQIIKQALGLPMITYKYVRLEPDINFHVRSFRNCVHSRESYFIYCKPLFDFDKYYNLCNLRRVDWSFINDVHHIQQSHKRRPDFKKSKVFREIFGIDDSNCLNNFLIKDDVIYSVDEDNVVLDINNVTSSAAKRFIKDHRVILIRVSQFIVIDKLKRFILELLRI